MSRSPPAWRAAAPRSRRAPPISGFAATRRHPGHVGAGDPPRRPRRAPPASRIEPSSTSVARQPSGRWQPPPSSCEQPPLGVDAAGDAGVVQLARAARPAGRPARVSMASAPWPGAGSMTSGGRARARSRPSRSSSSRSTPAAASRIASYWPSRSLRTRVGTLPRRAVSRTSGRSASAWAARRSDEVPTTAPAGRPSGIGVVGRQRARPREQQVGRGPRSGIAASSRPSGSSVGRSLSEWTTRSTRPSSSASCSSLVKKPLPSILWKATSWIRSPWVLMISMPAAEAELVARPAPRRRCACHRARSDPRVPRRSACRRRVTGPLLRPDRRRPPGALEAADEVVDDRAGVVPGRALAARAAAPGPGA